VDRTVFCDDLFESYEEKPTDPMINKGIRRAEADCGITVAAVAVDAVERSWLDNRVERHVIFELMRNSAYDHDHGQDSLSQVYEALRKILEMLDDEWEKTMKAGAEALKKTNLGTNPVFGIIGSGYKYDRYGVPSR
jgi:hypothetical protein